jgi:hypothetical protein
MHPVWQAADDLLYLRWGRFLLEEESLFVRDAHLPKQLLGLDTGGSRGIRVEGHAMLHDDHTSFFLPVLLLSVGGREILFQSLPQLTIPLQERSVEWESGQELPDCPRVTPRLLKGG